MCNWRSSVCFLFLILCLLLLLTYSHDSVEWKSVTLRCSGREVQWSMKMEKKLNPTSSPGWSWWGELTLMERTSKSMRWECHYYTDINRTLKSNITCREEEQSSGPPQKLTNPCCDDDSACDQYNVSAKGFFSSYQQKMQDNVLDGARNLISEVWREIVRIEQQTEN